MDHKGYRAKPSGTAVAIVRRLKKTVIYCTMKEGHLSSCTRTQCGINPADSLDGPEMLYKHTKK